MASEDELATIKARRAAVTSAPWRIRAEDSGRVVESAARHHSFTGVAFSHSEDAIFVAHAPADIDRLLAEVAALRERVAALEEALRPFAAIFRLTPRRDPQWDYHWFASSDGRRITWGDLRRAAAALPPADGAGEGS